MNHETPILRRLRPPSTIAIFFLSLTPMGVSAQFIGPEWSEEDPGVVAAWEQMSYVDPFLEGLAKGQSSAFCSFPNEFRLDDLLGNYLASGSVRDQGQCGYCKLFTVVRCLEIEAKRALLMQYGLPPSFYDLDLSENEVITRTNGFYNVASVVEFLNDFDVWDITDWIRRTGWTIPFESVNPYDPANCNGTNSMTTEGYPGVKLTGKFYCICRTDDETAVKYTLYRLLKGVAVSLRVEDGDENRTYIDKEYYCR